MRAITSLILLSAVLAVYATTSTITMSVSSPGTTCLTANTAVAIKLASASALDRELTITMTTTGGTLSTSTITIAKGATGPTTDPTITSTASGVITVSFSTDDAYAVLPEPLVFATPSTYSASDSTSGFAFGIGTIYSGTTQQVSFCRDSTIATAAKTYTITASQAAITTTSSVTMAAGVSAFTIDLTIGSFSGEFTMTATASDNSQTATLTYTSTAQGSLTLALPEEIFIETTHTIVATLSFAAPASVTANLAITGGAAASTTFSAESLMFAAGETTKNFTLTTSTTPGNLEFLVTLTGNAPKAYAVSEDKAVLPVNPRGTGVATVIDPPSPLPIYTTSNATVSIDTGRLVPIGTCLTINIAATFCADTTTSARRSAYSFFRRSKYSGLGLKRSLKLRNGVRKSRKLLSMMTTAAGGATATGTGVLSGTIPAIVICERQRTATFILPAPRSSGNLTLSFAISGSAIYAFNAPADLMTRIETRATVTVATIPTSLYAGETSDEITVDHVGKLSTALATYFDLELSGDGARGARASVVTTGTAMTFPVLLTNRTENLKVQITAGSTIGDLTVLPVFSGKGASGVAEKEASTVTIKATNTVNVTNFPAGVANGKSSAFTITLGAAPADGAVTVTCTSSDTTLLTTDGPVEFAVSATNLVTTFNVTAAASGTGQVTVMCKLSGDGAAQYGPVNGGAQLNTFVVDANGIGVTIQTRMFTENTITGTVVLGQAATNGLTVTAAEKQSTSLATISTIAPFDATTTTATFTVVSGTTPGLLTLGYTLSGNSASIFSAGAADTVIAISDRYPVLVTGFKALAPVNTEFDLTVSIPAKVPVGETLTVKVTCTSGTFVDGGVDGTETAALAVFGAGGSSTVIKYKTPAAPTTTTPETLSYENSGSFTYALSTRASDSFAVLGSIVATFPTTLEHETTTNVTLTVEDGTATVLSGRTLTAMVKATNAARVSGGAPYAVSTTVTFDSTGTGILAIRAPAILNAFTLSIELGGTAGSFFFKPADVSIQTTAQITITGSFATLATGATSDLLIVTLSTPVPSDSTTPLILTPEVTTDTGDSIDVTFNPASLVFLSGQSQKSFRVAAGSQIGSAIIALRVSSDSGAALTAAFLEPFSFTASIRGVMKFYNLPTAIETGSTTSNIMVEVGATPTAMSQLTITASTGSVTLASDIIFNTTSTTGNFSITAPSSAATMTLTFALSGLGQDDFVLPDPIKIIAIASGSIGAIIGDSSLFGTQCTNVTLGFFPALATGGSLTIGATLSGENTGASVTSPAVINVGDTSGMFEVCAGTLTGTLTLTYTTEGDSAGTYPTLPTSLTETTIAVTAQGRISGLAPAAALSTGSTSTLTATLSVAIGSTGPLTLTVVPVGPRGIQISNIPFIFTEGETEKTFTLTTPYVESSFSLTYGLFGPSAVAYEAPADSTTTTITFPDPAFTVATVVENSGVPGAMNTLTVLINPNRPINKGATISITGLYFECSTDSNCGNRVKRISSMSPAGTFQGAGFFRKDSLTTVSTGTFTLKVRGTVLPGQESTFSFAVQNPVTALTTALTPMIGAKSGGATFPDQAFTETTAEPTTSASIMMAGDQSTYAVTLTATETTAVKTAYNTITFAIAPTKDGVATDIPAGSSITISGISNIQTAANKALEVTGTDAETVGSVCVLEHTDPDSTGIPSGTLTFTVTQTIRSSQGAAELAVTLNNADTTQTAPTFTLTVDGAFKATTTLASTVLKADEAITGTFTGLAATTQATVVGATTAADCAIKGGDCSICIAFSPTLGQVAGDVIRIHGLNPSLSADSTATGTMAEPFANGAKFNALLGLAEITLTSDIGFGESGTFCMSVVSPRNNGNTIALSVSSVGRNPSFATSIATVPSTFLNPTTEPDNTWVTASVYESSRVASTANSVHSNTLTFVLQPKSDIASGAVFTISFATALRQGDNQDELNLATSINTPIGGATAITSIFSTATIGLHASSLTLTSSSAMTADGPTVFAVQVPNPTASSTGIACTLTASGTGLNVPSAAQVLATPQYATGSGVLMADQTTEGWITSTISQTSLMTLGVNTLTIALRPTTEIRSGSVLSFTGLTNLPGPETADSPIAVTSMEDGVSTGGSLLGGLNVGVWDPETGVLSLTLQNTLPIDKTTSLMFEVTNPTTTPTTAYTISVSVVRNNLIVLDATALTVPTTSAGNGLAIFATTQGLWSVASMEQPSVADCNFCAINIYLKPTVAIAQGATITITGFTGSPTADNTALTVDDTTLTETADQGMFGGSCAWTQTTGSLVCTVALATGMGTTNIVGLKLQSIEMPYTPLSVSPTVTVSNTNVEPDGKALQGVVFLPAFPPVLLGKTPEVNDVMPASTAKVFLEFERQIMLTGSGSIQFYKCSDQSAAGSAITCDAASTNVLIANDDYMLQVTPGTEVTETDGECFFMVMSEGCVSATTKLGGERYEGFPTDEFTVRFFTDTQTVLNLESVVPDFGTAISFGTSLFEFTFDTEVTRASKGFIELIDLSTQLPVPEATINIADTTNDNGVVLTFDNNIMRYEISPAILQKPLSQYRINVAPNSLFSTQTGARFAGTSNAAPYTVRAPAGTPVLSSTSPVFQSTGVQAGNKIFSITFESEVQLGTGSFGLYRQSRSTDTAAQSATDVVSCSSATLSTDGRTVSFETSIGTYAETDTPSQQGIRGFYGLVSSDCVYAVDSSNNWVYWPGFTASTDWRFYVQGTATTPTITTSSPLNGDEAFSPTMGWITLDFTYPVKLRTGAFTLYQESQQASLPDVPVFSTSILSTESVDGNRVVELSADSKQLKFYIGTSTLDSAKVYFAEISGSAVVSEATGVAFPGFDGLNDDNGNVRTLRFTTDVVKLAGLKNEAPSTGGDLCLPPSDGASAGCLTLPNGLARSNTGVRQTSTRPIVIEQSVARPDGAQATTGTVNLLSSEVILQPHGSTFSSAVTVCFVSSCFSTQQANLEDDATLTAVKKVTTTVGSRTITQWEAVDGGEEVTQTDGTCQFCIGTSSFSNWASSILTPFPTAVVPDSVGSGSSNPGGVVNGGGSAGVFFASSASTVSLSMGLLMAALAATIALVL